MKLVITHDNGDCEVVAEDLEVYNLSNSLEIDDLLDAIERTINKVKAFQAATPPEAED